MVVVWSKRAVAELRKAYEYIDQDSPQNARKFRDTLIDLTLQIPNHPEAYHWTNTKAATMVVGVPLKNTGTGFLIGS